MASKAWTPIATPTFAAGSLFAAAIVYFANSGQRWVPILDAANLIFHEAGHPIFGMLWEPLGVYGGTLGQLVFPTVCIYYFWKERHSGSFFICCIWLCQNLWNIARYMADARAQILPLVGNGDRLHDWAEILERWQVLEKDTRLASKLVTISAIGCFVSWAWFFQKWKESRVAGDSAQGAIPPHNEP